MDMGVLGLKLLLAPSLVGAASLAGRRWGPQVAGWLAGFPIIAGPISLFFALEHGREFGAHAARGTLTGIVSMAAFAVAYGWTARRVRWPASLLAGYSAFAASTLMLWHLEVQDLVFQFAIATAAVGVGLRSLPELGHAPQLPSPTRWDLPVRMSATAALVLTVTGLAAGLGPRLSGMLAPFPIAGTVLVVFAHRESGPQAVIRVLKGFLTSLIAFASFFAVLGSMLERWSVPATFSVALLVAALVQAVTVSAHLVRAPSARPMRG